MSVAYEQSALTAVGARVRRLVLGIVLFTSLAVNVIFAVCTLVNPISIYAVFVFGLLLTVIGWLVDYTLADAEEVAEAVMSNFHPALLRAPVCMSYEWIVGTWLAWWCVSQLLFSAGIVYGHSLVGSIIVVPVLVGVIGLRVFASALEMRSLESWLMLTLQLATYTLLFFPSTDWAPQYIGIPMVCARVVLFFIGIMLASFLEPPVQDVSLDGAAGDDGSRPVHDVETEVRRLMNNSLYDAESGGHQQQAARFERARAMLGAHARITREHRRMRNTVALTAWVLVLPLPVVAIAFPVLLVALIYESAKSKRARTIPPTAVSPPTLAPNTPLVVVPPQRTPIASLTPLDMSDDLTPQTKLNLH